MYTVGPLSRITTGRMQKYAVNNGTSGRMQKFADKPRAVGPNLLAMPN